MCVWGVCVCEREREERDRDGVLVCVCVRERWSLSVRVCGGGACVRACVCGWVSRGPLWRM